MKRRAIKLLLLLFAGAIINVAVALLAAWRTQIVDADFVTSRKSQMVAWHADGTLHIAMQMNVVGCDRVFYWRNVGGAQEMIEQVKFNRLLPPFRESLVLSHSSFAAEVKQLRSWSEHTAVMDVIAGWPLRSLTCRLFYAGSPIFNWIERPNIRWGIVFEDRAPGVPVVAPYKPLATGCAINTIFYAAVLWVLFAVPMRVRCWRRIKRGVCVHCAYPVGASDVCSECGKPVKAVHGASPPATPN